MSYSKILLILVILTKLCLMECTFPNCEDILKEVDGKTNCEFCSVQRMKTACKDVCDFYKCNVM